MAKEVIRMIQDSNKKVQERVRYSRQSITPSGYFGSSSDNIVEIENFITEEEQQYLLNFAKNNTEWDITESQWNENGNIIYDHRVWENRVATVGTLKKADPKVVEILTLVTERMQPIIENKFNVEVFPAAPAIVRWPVGTMQFPHADKELHEGPDAGTPNEFPWYDIGTVFYINDDYVGGELYFPKQNIVFKTKARGAYFFPGDMNYIHGVNKVKEGCRYTFPLFWTVTKLEREKND
jgi:hypothetical protein